MGSTRFPGKVLKQLGDKTVLGWVVDRTRNVSRLDDVVVATTNKGEDDVLERWCAENQVKCFRGSSDDLLTRYFECALAEKAKSVVRITADCPLIESSLVDAVILAGRSGSWDYFRLGGDFPDGLDCEWLTFEALETAYRSARLASDREHVTTYLLNNSKMFKLGALKPFDGLSHIRLTIDEPEDLAAIIQIIGLSSDNLNGPCIEETLSILANHVDVSELNSHITRNEGLIRSLAQDSEESEANHPRI